MSETYECVGDVCGRCGHRHRTLSGAARCLARSQAGCAAQGGYSDRVILRSDGQRMFRADDEGHYMDEDDLAWEAEQQWRDNEDLRRRRREDAEARRAGEAGARGQVQP